MHSDFYVYEWFIQETGEVFYIGKGRKNRFKERHLNADIAEKIREQYNTGVKFASENLTEEQAIELESSEMIRMPGRAFIDLDDLNAQARHWMTIANSKVHGTTGQIPLLQLSLEGLKELPQDGRHLEYTWEYRKVSNDGFVSFDGVRYGVKWHYCGQVLKAKQIEQKLYLENYEGEIVQVHEICRTSRKYVYALGQYDGLLLAEGQPKPPAYGRQISHAEVAIRNLTDYAAFAGGF